MTVVARRRVLDYEENNLRTGYIATAELAELWLSIYAPLRKTERFKKFVREAGLVDYWKAGGWPDLCHPTKGDDFECN